MDFVDDDFLLALELQEQLDKQSWQPSQPPSKPSTNLSIVDESWEYIDPNPDIRELFLQFNTEFFWGRLAGIEVKWSPRMTLCAGLCVYEGRGGLCSVRLSLPLLKLRPRRDLVETLLHEMIHAYLFVTDNNKDHDGHGPEFHKHMYRINNATGTKISVYHNFHDEVDQYRQHWWRCNGPCQNRKPFFGYVKRAMNRAPSERDPWWKDHKNSCNGTYIKIKEPEGYGKKKAKEKGGKSEKVDGKSLTGEKNSKGDIRSFLGKGHVLPSGQNQKKVIINGVLTEKISRPTSTVSSSKDKSPQKSGKDVQKSRLLGNTSNSPQKSRLLGVTSDSPHKSRVSVSAINTSGKISDKELQRQQKFAELMFSDSDDDDLIMCDQHDSSKTVLSNEDNGCEMSPSRTNDNSQNKLLGTSIDNKLDISSNISSKNSSVISINSSNMSEHTTSQLPLTEKSVSVVKSNSQSVVDDVASHVRNIWANKQFGPSLKPLDPKANGINFNLNKLKTKSSTEHTDQCQKGNLLTGEMNVINVKKTNKRLSGEDLNASRKKQKTDSEHENRIDDMFRTQQNENSVPNLSACPVCTKSVPSSQINQHLDQCLGIS